jgi:hypothetical protein
MIGAAIAAGWSAWATAAAVAVDAAIVAAGTLSAVSQYQQGKEEQRQANFQANEARKQAQLEQERANIAQIQGEQEAERRMRAYSQEIGSVYANAAGNGILIDSGSAGDTLGKTLDTSATFAAKDVSTIRDNTALSIWTHEANEGQLLRSAANYRKQGKAAYKAGILGATAAGFKTVGSLGTAFASGGGFQALGAGSGNLNINGMGDFPSTSMSANIA